jgi:hypothetical protein
MNMKRTAISDLVRNEAVKTTSQNQKRHQNNNNKSRKADAEQKRTRPQMQNMRT